jgi:predicted TIM-barrel fold metal-dependent hydrolase
VPHVRWDPEAQEEAWYIEDQRLYGVGNTALAGWPEPFPRHPATYDQAHPGSYDAAARLRYMDEIGCDAQVLYPNVGGFGNQLFLELREPELMLECVRAYNDFQLDWISVDPRRFIAIMATPFWNVAATAAEVERCAARGHRGILFTASPQDFGQPYLGDRHWDPLWSVAQETGLPISFHIGSGGNLDGFSPERLAVDGPQATYARTSCNLFLGNGMQLADLLLSGVLPRFPELKFVSVESGLGWIPFLLEAADYSFHAASVRRERPEFELLPSDYFRRQVYSCYWFETLPPESLLERLGLEHVLFETDFPHPTCLYGNVQETIESGLGPKPAPVREKILRGNAAALYRLAPAGT